MSAILTGDRPPAPQATFRRIYRADLEAVYAVERRAYSHPWTLGILSDCLRVGYHCWMCEIGGRPGGHGVMSVAVGEAHILNLCIDPPWQGRGLGRQLLQRLLRQAREQGADTAFLEVRASNRAAIALYDALGFNEIGQRRGYYPADAAAPSAPATAADTAASRSPAPREDALVFAKAL